MIIPPSIFIVRTESIDLLRKIYEDRNHSAQMISEKGTVKKYSPEYKVFSRPKEVIDMLKELDDLK